MQLSRRQAISSIGALVALPAFSSLGRAHTRLGCSATASDFLAAVRQGEVERVRSLLGEDASLARARDAEGRSAFVLANVLGHEEIAALLFATGLELDLVESVLGADWKRFDALAAAQPELLNALHPIGGTPMYAAALVGSLGFWRLRSKGCERNSTVVGSSGFTPVRGALESTNPAWAGIALSDLCGNGSDINLPQARGSSVLHGAVARRDEVLVRLAIRKGANVAAKDDAGRSAEVLARELGWEAGAQLLSKHELLPHDNRSSRFALNASREPVVRPDLADVPQELQNQVTGSSHMNLKKLQELVSKDKCLIFSISTDDELAIEACAHVGSREIIRFHLDQGAPLSLPTAVSLGDEASVEAWLRADASLVHERGAHDFPVMWYALLGGGGVAMAELLVERGASVDQESMGTTTLHWCARNEDADLAKYLIEQGADVEALGYKFDRHGQTPLQTAEEQGSAKMVSLLKSAGAKR